MSSHSPAANDRGMVSLTARTIKAGMTYFALVFGAGFVLGSIRIPFLVPRLGERAAELIETPFMLVVVWVAARYITRRFSLPAHALPLLGAGFLALALLVAAEVLLAVALQDRTLGEYIASRDPVSGSVYLASLALFAVMPLVLARVTSASHSKLSRDPDDDSSYPGGHDSDCGKSDWPCRYAASEPLRSESGVYSLRDDKDESRNDADHDGRE